MDVTLARPSTNVYTKPSRHFLIPRKRLKGQVRSLLEDLNDAV